MTKQCSNCGYSASDSEIKCPLCGKRLITVYNSFDSTCDPVEEKEWNSGYHNDFEEGRKTGEYCDPRFEKYLNGGDHYHGTEKESYNEEVSYNRKTSYSQPPRDITELPPKAQVIIVLLISFFLPIFGPVCIMAASKKDGSINEAGRARILLKTAKICLTVTIIWLIVHLLFGLVLANINI